ncbi:MAG: DUF177 domain-containing protein [Bacteroidales bacterium]|nr:DUF177 domain-containing protein [Bacteroidales bacterium]MBN2748311.1 DUF177 domain-containing protein [Bacteroidales bacterium]
MKRQLSSYSIFFKGLKVGIHDFEFDIDDKFFELFEESEVKNGKLLAKICLEKRNNMLEVTVNITGNVEVLCDRCLEYFSLPTSYNGKFYVRYGENEVDDDEYIVISPDESELNLAQYIYESTWLSLPYKRYHGIKGTDQKACNQEMLSKIGYISNDTPEEDEPEEEPVDPRWNKLRDLNFN